jgi:hypothetical protein
MNIAKNMEVIFVAATLVLGSIGYATSTPRSLAMPAAAVAAAKAPADKQLVMLGNKRQQQA